jgi:hypothetical protein
MAEDEKTKPKTDFPKENPKEPSGTQDDFMAIPQINPSEEKPKNNHFREKQKEPFWTQDFVKFLFPYLDKWIAKYVDFNKDSTEAENKIIETKSRHNRRLTGILLGFLAITIIAMSVLVFYKMVSGDSLLFAVGTIFGYVLSMVQKLIYPAEMDVPTKQESD